MDKRKHPRQETKRQPLAWTQAAFPFLGLIGMGVSGYLTYVHYAHVAPACLAAAPCDAVLSSRYAQMWGVPISLLGLLLYAVLTGMGFWLWRERGERQRRIVLGTYAAALSGTIFTGYLYFLEIFELHVFCTWCIASSIVMVSILVLSTIDLFSSRVKIEERSRACPFQLFRSIQW